MVDDHPRFHERQLLRMVWVWTLVMIVALSVWVLLGGYLIFGLDVGPNPPPRWLAAVLLLVIGIGLPLLLVTFRLVTTVTDDELRFAVVPFLSRQIPLADIESAEAVQYRPMREYLGWGVKWMPGRGWAYTVQGDRGVRVHLKSGTSFLLGSERPEQLAAALNGGAATGTGDTRPSPGVPRR